MARGIEKPDGIWHLLDTVVLSLGLQLAAGVWLVRADVFEWGWLVLYAVVVGALQFGYVRPRINSERPFIPIVLIGSVLVWNALAILFAEQANVDVWLAAFGLNAAIAGHWFLHHAQWKSWGDEARFSDSRLMWLAIGALAVAGVGAMLSVGPDNSEGDKADSETIAALTKTRQVANDQARMTYKLYAAFRACGYLGPGSPKCAQRIEAVDRYAKQLGYTPDGFDLPYPPPD